MITTFLALLAQAQPVSAPMPVALSAAGTEAMRCASATASISVDDPMPTMAAVTWHIMRAARADRGGKPYLDRVQELTPVVAGYLPAAGEAAGIAADCRKRFPLAWTSAPASPPGDIFARDVTCVMALSIMAGAGEAFQESRKDSTYADRYHASQKRFTDRVTDKAIGEHGIATADAYRAYVGDQLLASLALGNVLSVSATCEALAL